MRIVGIRSASRRDLEKIKYIAAYQSQPISAITHYAPVDRIEPYGESGKYKLIFSEKAQTLGPIPMMKTPPREPLQGPRYTTFEKLKVAKNSVTCSESRIIGSLTRTACIKKPLRNALAPNVFARVRRANGIAGEIRLAIDLCSVGLNRREARPINLDAMEMTVRRPGPKSACCDDTLRRQPLQTREAP